MHHFFSGSNKKDSSIYIKHSTLELCVVFLMHRESTIVIFLRAKMPPTVILALEITMCKEQTCPRLSFHRLTERLLDLGNGTPENTWKVHSLSSGPFMLSLIKDIIVLSFNGL